MHQNNEIAKHPDFTGSVKMIWDNDPEIKYSLSFLYMKVMLLPGRRGIRGGGPRCEIHFMDVSKGRAESLDLRVFCQRKTQSDTCAHLRTGLYINISLMGFDYLLDQGQTKT